MDEELIPVALFVEDKQGNGKVAEEGGRWARIRESLGI
jgi:hypothetical protein